MADFVSISTIIGLINKMIYDESLDEDFVFFYKFLNSEYSFRTGDFVKIIIGHIRTKHLSGERKSVFVKREIDGRINIFYSVIKMKNLSVDEILIIFDFYRVCSHFYDSKYFIESMYPSLKKLNYDEWGILYDHLCKYKTHSMCHVFVKCVPDEFFRNNNVIRVLKNLTKEEKGEFYKGIFYLVRKRGLVSDSNFLEIFSYAVTISEKCVSGLLLYFSEKGLKDLPHNSLTFVIQYCISKKLIPELIAVFPFMSKIHSMMLDEELVNEILEFKFNITESEAEFIEFLRSVPKFSFVHFSELIKFAEEKNKSLEFFKNLFAAFCGQLDSLEKNFCDDFFLSVIRTFISCKDRIGLLIYFADPLDCEMKVKFRRIIARDVFNKADLLPEDVDKLITSGLISQNH